MTTTEKTAATRRIRKSFEQATGLRTYSISWIHAEDGDLFAADAPWAPVHEESVLEWMIAAEQASGHALDIDIRNTRMTVKFA